MTWVFYHLSAGVPGPSITLLINPYGLLFTRYGFPPGEKWTKGRTGAKKFALVDAIAGSTIRAPARVHCPAPAGSAASSDQQFGPPSTIARRIADPVDVTAGKIHARLPVLVGRVQTHLDHSHLHQLTRVRFGSTFMRPLSPSAMICIQVIAATGCQRVLKHDLHILARPRNCPVDQLRTSCP